MIFISLEHRVIKIQNWNGIRTTGREQYLNARVSRKGAGAVTVIGVSHHE